MIYDGGIPTIDELDELTLTETQAQVIIAQGPQGATGATGPQGPKGDTGTLVEILDAGTTSKYTAEELRDLATNKAVLAYNGNVILQWSYYLSKFNFTFVTVDVLTGLAKYYPSNGVGASKAITIGTARTIPIKVNNVIADSSANITLQASDISAANDWSPTNNTDLATKKYVDDNAKALIVTLTEDNGDLVTDGATPAEIYAAWTAGKPIFIKPSDSDFYVPLLSAKYESDAYTFFAMATEAINGSAAVTTWYASYDENGWEVSSESVLGLPGVSSADEGKVPIVTNLGGWDLQAFPTIPTVYYEIYDKTENGTEYSKYTGAELKALMETGGAVFTYNGNPVVQYNSTVPSFKYYKGTGSGTPALVYKKMTALNLKTVADDDLFGYSSVYVPLSVNNKAFTSTNALTLEAGDITAASGWSPSNDEDLATKGYVDNLIGNADTLLGNGVIS